MAAAVLAVVVLLGVAGVIVVYSGAYNVAATEDHTSFVRWAFETTFHNSVERRAPEPEEPVAITQEALAGGRRTTSRCVSTATPGRAQSGPRGRAACGPGRLTSPRRRRAGSSPIWIAKHGVRMTGMPAFGPTHDDRTLWGIAAFVKKLPAMTPEEYAALGGAVGRHSSAGGTSVSGQREARP
jgi:hypothetical protein